MNVVISGGKTGGHIFPGIALSEVFKDSGDEVCFFSPVTELDREILGKHKIEYYKILSKSPSDGLVFLWFAFLGLVQSLYYLKKVKPQIVIGLGGYPSVPAVIAAWLLRIDVVLLEQNVKPGRATMFLHRFAKNVCVSFEKTVEYFLDKRSKIVVTGNPVRKEIISAKKKDKQEIHKKFKLTKDHPIVLVMGGSQGAKAINDVLHKCIIDLDKQVQFIHITGTKQYDHFLQVYKKHDLRAHVMPFYYDIGELMVISDVVISRSGATTVSELLFLKKHCVLIPFAAATGGHQEYNARVLQDLRFASLIKEENLDVDSVKRVLKDKFVYMEKYKNLVMEEVCSASNIVNLINDLTSNS